MASSSSRSRKRAVVLDLDTVPAALREQLGLEAAGGLVQLLNRAHKEWSTEVLNVAAERFDRRLVEETSKLRIEMVQGLAAVRQEMATLGSDLRQEMATLGSDLRQEMATLGSALRQEMATQGSDLRQEMATLGSDLRRAMGKQHNDLVKWAFLFWIGQIGATTAIVALMMRGLR